MSKTYSRSRFDETIEKVAKSLELRPGTEEDIEDLKKSIMSKIEDMGYEAVAVGSSARGTYLPEKIDVDIFFYLPGETPREDLERIGLEVGNKALSEYSPETHYAEHPYVKAEIGKIDVEIVPCYKIKDKITSAVDRSPLHHRYLIERLDEDKKKEIKLLKKFLRNMNCYGAKEEVQGFSGFLCELLVLKYGSFKAVLESALKWKRGKVIDLEEHGEISFKDPLVVIDPVDPERNAAAAVSEEKLGRFMVNSKKFLEEPTTENYENSITINKNLLRNKNLLLITIPYPKDTVSEIAWSQLRKMNDDLVKTLQEKEFEVYRSVHWADEKKNTCILLDLRNTKLPKYQKHRGPPFYLKDHLNKFTEENEEVFVEGNRVYSWRKREEKEVEQAVKNFLQDTKRIPSRYKEQTEEAEVTTNLKKILKKKEVVKEYLRP